MSTPGIAAVTPQQPHRNDRTSQVSNTIYFFHISVFTYDFVLSSVLSYRRSTCQSYFHNRLSRLLLHILVMVRRNRPSIGGLARSVRIPSLNQPLHIDMNGTLDVFVLIKAFSPNIIALPSVNRTLLVQLKTPKSHVPLHPTQRYRHLHPLSHLPLTSPILFKESFAYLSRLSVIRRMYSSSWSVGGYLGVFSMNLRVAYLQRDGNGRT